MKIKKIASLFAATAMVLSLAACGGSGSGSTSTTAAAAGNAPAAAASGDTMTITVAHSLFEGTPEHNGILKFKEIVEEKSGGRMQVQVYPNSTLGGESTAVEGVQNNNITMTFANTALLSNYVPQCEIFDLPFLFDSAESASTVLNDASFIDDFGKNFSGAHLQLVGTSVTGFRWMTANKPINSFVDMKGLKIRTMENKNHMTLWNSLGTNATPMSGAELFTALQQGTVEGQENPISTILNGKIYEVNNYCVDTRHIISVSAWLVNDQWYAGLSEEDKAIFDEAIKTCVEFATSENASQEAENLKALEEKGMTIVRPDDAWYASMKDAVGDSVEKLVREDIGDEAVDSIVAVAGK